MFEIDLPTIYTCAAILLLALTTPLLSPFFRGRKLLPLIESQPAEDTEDTATEAPLPSISIVLTPHEKATELEQNLPHLLSQQYGGKYEVIVVAWKGDSDTEDVLKRFEHNDRFYHTYIPDSSRYMSRKKLAMTLGAKASKCEWLLFTEIECVPQSDQWLALMASGCSPSTDIVMGHTRYDDDTPSYRRFKHLFDQLYLLSEARRGTAYRTSCANLLLRKSVFNEGEGFRGNLKYLRGEYDFLVNKYADGTNTSLQLAPDAWLTEQAPSSKTWINKHLFYLETRQHLRRSLRHRCMVWIDAAALHATLTAFIAVAATAAVFQRWIPVIAAAVGIIILTSLRTLWAKKVTSRFGENFSTLALLPYELATVWHRLATRLRYWRADKNDFISHKL